MWKGYHLSIEREYERGTFSTMPKHDMFIGLRGGASRYNTFLTTPVMNAILGPAD